MPQRLRLSRIQAGLVCWIAAACISNLIWIQLNASPPRMWDDAEYLADSLIMYQTLERGDMVGFVRAASRPARGVHPPMPKLVPVPMYFVFGLGVRSALYSYTCLIPVFCLYVFLLARRISGNDWTALVAVIITCCFPLTYGLWRHVMAEFGLAVATVAAQYHLLCCAEGGARSRKHGVLAGAFVGWGLLWKVSLPLFVVGPFVYLLASIVVGTSRHPARRSCVHALLLTATVALIVAGPFYVLRFRSLWNFMLFNSTPSTSLEQFTLGPLLSPLTVLKYWTALVNIGTSAYFFGVFAGLCVLQVIRRTLPFSPPQRWFLGACVVPPVVVLSFHQLKEPRHLFPAFAAFAIVVAAMLADNVAAIPMRRRTVVLATVLAFPIYQFAFMSFSIPWVPLKDIRIGPFALLYADRDVPRIGALPSYAYPANPTYWPLREIVELLAAHSHDIKDRPARVRIVGLIPFVNGAVLNYASLLYDRQPLEYNLPDNVSLHPTWWDFLVVLSGPISQYSDWREPQLQRMLEAQRLPFTEFQRVALPQGREAVLYRVTPTSGLLSARMVGENLIIARDRNGLELFPDHKAEWTLPSARRSVAVVSARVPIEFTYMFVPNTTMSLNWQLVRNPESACENLDLPYKVTIFDLHSRRGPAREISREFRLEAGQESTRERLEIWPFRGQIVTIRLVPPSEADVSNCIGWSDLRMTADSSGAGSSRFPNLTKLR